jgi:hypothetical protein
MEPMEAAPPEDKAKSEPKKLRLAALFWALHQPERAGSLFPKSDEKETRDLASELFHKNQKPDLNAACKFFAEAQKAPVPDRLQCLLTVAVVAADQNQNDVARTCLQEAAKLVPAAVKDSPKDDKSLVWVLLPLGRLAVQLHQPTEPFAQPLTREQALAGRLRLEQYRRDLEGGSDPGPESWSQAVPDKAVLSHALALEIYARRQARTGGGSAALATVEGVEQEKVRPLGLVGAALGAQDKGR